MFRRVINPARYPATVVFLALGGFAVTLAYASYNLFHFSMANLHFLLNNGWLAVQEGALRQLLGILASGILALVSFLGFKICEADLVNRFRAWVNR